MSGYLRVLTLFFMVNEMTVHTKLFCSNEGYDKEFRDFMLSDFDDDEKYKEVMRQWAHQSCAFQPNHVVKGD